MEQKRETIAGYLELFSVFFKIGIGAIGGGYAMIPLLEQEIVEKRSWLDKQEFLDIMAVAQATPGVFAVNMASHIGYRLRGITASIVATLGNILPSFVIILLIALFFEHFKDSTPWIEYAFRGLRPAVVALIAVPVWSLAKAAKLNIYTLLVAIAVAILIWWAGVSPILLILAAILFACLWVYYKNYRKKL